MTTTLTKFANAKRANYCTLPTIDVEIFPDVHHCNQCSERIDYDAKLRPFGQWYHLTANTDCTYVSPMVRCRYCHSETHATHHQMAWSDETHCTRCGGVDGYAIGD